MPSDVPKTNKDAREVPPRGRRASLGGGLLVGVTGGAYAAAILALRPGYQAVADSHYHFSVARDVARGRLVPDAARNLPLTVLHDMPVDHYWGYHWLLAPFALIPNAEIGMKLATVALFAAIFVAIYLFLNARGVVYAWAWALAPALFSTQDWRYLQLRGAQVIVPLLFATTHVAFFEPVARTRRLMLVAIGYVALASYHGGLVLLPLHAAGVLALFLLDRSALAPWQVFEPALTAAGMALGLTLNPYMDARASTWRFFAFHVGMMGTDSAHLYDDQDVSQFHGFPFAVLVGHPEWLLLLIATLVAVAFVVRGSFSPDGTRKRPARDAIVVAGMSLAGVALTAQATRMREYSVPVAFALLAVLAPKRPPSRVVAALAASIIGIALVVHGSGTLPLMESHLPTREYRGARPLLEANGDHLVLNVAEADYSMLRWEYSRIVCVQGLSRYFIYPYPQLFHDVWEIHDRIDTSPETLTILRRFYERGVRLVAAHRTHKMAHYASLHPDLLPLAFRSDVNGASIYRLDGEALDRELAAAPAR
jgi:hypothetical protein